MSTLESGPKLDWTRDNQMYERYRIWRKKVEFIFCSVLADSTPKQLVSYLKYWMGDQGIPLIEKWESTGKLDYSNAKETPATEGGRRRTLSSGYKVQTYWDLLDEEFKPKGNKLRVGVSTFLQELQDFFEYSVFYRFPHKIQQLQVILHTELILLQELQGSSRAGSFQQLFPVSPSILHGRIRLPASLQYSKAIQHKQASSNSIIELWTRSKQGDKPLNQWLTQVYNLLRYRSN